MNGVRPLCRLPPPQAKIKDISTANQGGKRQEREAILCGSFGIGSGGLDAKAALFWAFVGIPLAWGVWITRKNAVLIF